MNWVVYHIASGQAFFTGVALIVLAALADMLSHPIAKRVKIVAFSMGMIAVALSSTAIPYWYYAVAVFITMLRFASWFAPEWRRWASVALILTWLIAAAFEIPYHFTPTLQPVSSRSMTVIGDSVTSGMGGSDKSETWPKILAREHRLVIQDISHVGETAASALRRAKQHTIPSPIVIVEIGGNDLLGLTGSEKFERDLDALLNHVCQPDRQVVMFELPLPPFCHEFGRIQRTLARRYGVALIPKRVFLSVLSMNDSTLDSIHLTQKGHEQMAATVWNLVRSAFAGS